MGFDHDRYPTLTAGTIAAMVSGGEVSARDVTEAALSWLARLDGQLRAFREVWPEQARLAADAVDRAAVSGASLPLAGVPLGVKAWDGPQSPQAKRLIQAGCVPIGATSVPGHGTPWQTWGHTDRGPTVNPWRPDRVPGGSSAGSAAAVAAGIVPLATGTDGAGSIRIPAAWCGVVGVKPTAGRVPGEGPGGIRNAGPLSRTVADAAAYLDAVFGGTSMVAETRAGRAVRPVVAAWSATLGFASVDPETATIAEVGARRLAEAGAVVLADEPMILLDPVQAWPVLRGDRRATTGGPGAEPAMSRQEAEALRAENDRRLAELFRVVDVLLTPTMPAGPHGHEGPGEVMNVSLTWAFNISGHPAISVPAGRTQAGLPVGLQLVGRHRAEPLLIRLASAFEELASWPAPSPLERRWPGGNRPGPA